MSAMLCFKVGRAPPSCYEHAHPNLHASPLAAVRPERRGPLLRVVCVLFASVASTAPRRFLAGPPRIALAVPETARGQQELPSLQSPACASAAGPTAIGFAEVHGSGFRLPCAPPHAETCRWVTARDRLLPSLRACRACVGVCCACARAACQWHRNYGVSHRVDLTPERVPCLRIAWTGCMCYVFKAGAKGCRRTTIAPRFQKRRPEASPGSGAGGEKQSPRRRGNQPGMSLSALPPVGQDSRRRQRLEPSGAGAPQTAVGRSYPWNPGMKQPPERGRARRERRERAGEQKEEVAAAAEDCQTSRQRWRQCALPRDGAL